MKIKIGIMDEHLVRRRLLAIARGTYVPQEEEPTLWFSSLHAIAQLLSPCNLQLLRTISEKQPESVTELAAITGRAKSNLSNTLKNLSERGFLEFEKGEGRSVKPIAKYCDFEIVINTELEQRISNIAA